MVSKPSMRPVARCWCSRASQTAVESAIAARVAAELRRLFEAFTSDSAHATGARAAHRPRLVAEAHGATLRYAGEPRRWQPLRRQWSGRGASSLTQGHRASIRAGVSGSGR